MTFYKQRFDGFFLEIFTRKFQAKNNKTLFLLSSIIIDYREDFAGFGIERSQDGGFVVYDRIFHFDQNVFSRPRFTNNFRSEMLNSLTI